MPPTLLGAKNEYRKYRIKEKYELLCQGPSKNVGFGSLKM